VKAIAKRRREEDDDDDRGWTAVPADSFAAADSAGKSPPGPAAAAAAAAPSSHSSHLPTTSSATHINPTASSSSSSSSASGRGGQAGAAGAASAGSERARAAARGLWMEALRDRVESNPVLIYAQAHSAGDSHDDGLSPPHAAAQVRVRVRVRVRRPACLASTFLRPHEAVAVTAWRIPSVDAQP